MRITFMRIIKNLRKLMNIVSQLLFLTDHLTFIFNDRSNNFQIELTLWKSVGQKHFTSKIPRYTFTNFTSHAKYL